MITLPVGIVLLSGNLVMRTSATYVYHFNDSQVVSQVGSTMSGEDFADAFSGYFNSIKGGEFQVYEENGEFRDPIFDESESEAMGAARNIMTLTLLSAIVFLGASIAIYIYLRGNVDRVELRVTGMAALGLSAVAVVLADLAAHSQRIRSTLYSRFIEVPLSSESTLKLLLGSPFEKTYIIFSTVVAVAIICLLVYIHLSLTKERRIFS